ncbi:seed leukoagglutinin-like [Durio zibethinus]|uniref:Seed leukoagglutinin-like n=1 Tax=Durio zibethinus TaxID=66656 RepID=A0A6P6ALR5_DURZI|nr:seed leukoagglutinin-like [Durio zibethinus]
MAASSYYLNILLSVVHKIIKIRTQTSSSYNSGSFIFRGATRYLFLGLQPNYHLLPFYHMNFISSFLLVFVHLFLPFVHSFSFNITSFNPDSSNIIYEGDATVSSGAIELNRFDYLCRVGRAIYAHRVPLCDSSTLAVASIDLSETLSEWVIIGFSAGTGEYPEYNTIKSWDFTSNLDTKGKKLQVGFC